MNSKTNSPSNQDGVFAQIRESVTHLMMPPLELLRSEWESRMATRRKRINQLTRTREDVRRQGFEAAATLIGLHQDETRIEYGQSYFKRIEQQGGKDDA